MSRTDPPETLQTAHEHLSDIIRQGPDADVPEELAGRLHGVGFGLEAGDEWELVVDLEPPEDEADRDVLEETLDRHLEHHLGERPSPIRVRWREPRRLDRSPEER